MIIYASVCRANDAVMVAELLHPSLSGNVSEVMSQLMSSLKTISEACPPETRKTFSQRNQEDFFGEMVSSWTGGYYVSMGDDLPSPDYFFHVWLKDGVYYACISDDSQYREQSVNFDFLDEIEKEFTGKFRKGRINNCRKFGLKTPFLPTLREKMHHYNVNHQKLEREQKIQGILEKVEDMKVILGRNIRVVIEQQERELEVMQARSDIMEADAKLFKKRTKVLMQSTRRKRLVRNVLIALSVLVTIYILISLKCGWTLTLCHVSNKEE